LTVARLDFDFHPPARRPGTLGLGVLVVGRVAAIWVWTNWQTARASVAGLNVQLAAMEQKRPAAAPRPRVRTDEGARSSQARIASQLSYAWQPAFEALAAARSNSIALVSLDAVQAKSQVNLVAEARQLADAVTFIDALQQQPGVIRAALLQHEMQADNAQKPVRFTVQIHLDAADSTPAESSTATSSTATSSSAASSATAAGTAASGTAGLYATGPTP